MRLIRTFTVLVALTVLSAFFWIYIKWSFRVQQQNGEIAARPPSIESPHDSLSSTDVEATNQLLHDPTQWSTGQQWKAMLAAFDVADRAREIKEQQMRDQIEKSSLEAANAYLLKQETVRRKSTSKPFN